MMPHVILMGYYMDGLPFADAVLSDERDYPDTEDDYDEEEYDGLQE